MPEHSLLMNRVQFVGESLFIPFFLLATGMLVDLRALIGGTEVWLMAGGMVAVVIIGKWLASWISGRLSGADTDEQGVVFGLTLPHAAVTLAAIMAGVKIGLFDVATVNGAVVMILVSCTLGPILVQIYGRRVALATKDRPLVGEQPQRILIPLSNPKTADSLMDLALLCRDAGHAEPILPLQVICADHLEAADEVAHAEAQLAKAASHAAAADVPVAPLTRINLNVATAISQAVVETRSSLVLLGWKGEQSLESLVFGSTIDHVLADTTALTIVAHATQPWNTSRRVLIVVPPQAERHPGYPAAAKVIRHLVGRLGAPTVIWTVQHAPAATPVTFPDLETSMATATEVVPLWPELVSALRSQRTSDDLLILLSARRDSLTWQPAMAKLPALLAGDGTGNVLVVYPPEIPAT
jgi:nucleotide-binding universal stress UspA family protein